MAPMHGSSFKTMKAWLIIWLKSVCSLTNILSVLEMDIQVCVGRLEGLFS